MSLYLVEEMTIVHSDDVTCNLFDSLDRIHVGHGHQLCYCTRGEIQVTTSIYHIKQLLDTTTAHTEINQNENVVMFTKPPAFPPSTVLLPESLFAMMD